MNGDEQTQHERRRPSTQSRQSRQRSAVIRKMDADASAFEAGHERSMDKDANKMAMRKRKKKTKKPSAAVLIKELASGRLNVVHLEAQGPVLALVISSDQSCKTDDLQTHYLRLIARGESLLFKALSLEEVEFNRELSRLVSSSMSWVGGKKLINLTMSSRHAALDFDDDAPLVDRIEASTTTPEREDGSSIQTKGA